MRAWHAAIAAGLADAERHRDSDEPRIGARMLESIRRLARLDGIAPVHGSAGAGDLACAAARHLEPRVAGLMAIEIGSAVMAARWLPDERVAGSVAWTGMLVAERLLPPSDGDPGRDTGTWGMVAAAVAIDAHRGLVRAPLVANLAAALGLERVPDAETGNRYLALRASHAASTAILALDLADAGFIEDDESLTTLAARLGVEEPPVVSHPGRLAHLAVDLLEAAAA